MILQKLFLSSYLRQKLFSWKFKISSTFRIFPCHWKLNQLIGKSFNWKEISLPNQRWFLLPILALSWVNASQDSIASTFSTSTTVSYFLQGTNITKTLCTLAMRSKRESFRQDAWKCGIFCGAYFPCLLFRRNLNLSILH